MVTWHKIKMAAIFSTENSSKIYLQFLFSIEHSSWLSSRRLIVVPSSMCILPDKKHKKLRKWHKLVHQFKSITSEVLNYIIADIHWELVCNGKFHLGIDTVYNINLESGLTCDKAASIHCHCSLYVTQCNVHVTYYGVKPGYCLLFGSWLSLHFVYLYTLMSN